VQTGAVSPSAHDSVPVPPGGQPVPLPSSHGLVPATQFPVPVSQVSTPLQNRLSPQSASSVQVQPVMGVF
jgi:hypothetical protein